MLNAFIYDGLRTPIGRHAGKLSSIRPDDLAAGVIAEVVKRNGVKQFMKAGIRDGHYSEMSEGTITAGPDERRLNPRSSSAKLRWVTRA